MKKPLWHVHVQSFTLDDHIINTLNHGLFEQDNQTFEPLLLGIYYDIKLSSFIAIKHYNQGFL
jgi:hypothetical protein